MAWLSNSTVEALLLGSGGILVWALALYVASRASTRRISVLAGVAMLCLAWYLTGEALGALAPDIATRSAWLRRTWWAQGVALPVWLVLTLALAQDEGPQLHAARFLTPVGIVAIVSGVLFGAAGTLTNAVENWETPLADGARSLPAGPLLFPFQIFALICVVAAAITLALLWRASEDGTPLRARFGWFTASGLLFLFGAGWLVIESGFNGQPGLPGQLLLVIGMLILGWNVARYGALLNGEQVLSDFLAYAAAMLAIVAVYGAVLLTLTRDYGWLERGVPLLLLVMTSHVAVDTRGHLLDRLLYAPATGTLQGRLRDLANRVVRQPDEITALADARETVDAIIREGSPATELRVLVEGALRHMNDIPALSEHPLLLEIPSIANSEATPLERASHLRNELDAAIERLRPPGARPAPGSSTIGGWLHYLVLKEAYSEGRPNKQIMQRYVLSEGTFHRARRRAIDALATDLASRRRAIQPVYQ